jgi:hypothetical protein
MSSGIARPTLPLTGLIAAARMIPGQREAGALTRFALASTGRASTSNTTMDAATILERQREGGGAPATRMGTKS